MRVPVPAIETKALIPHANAAGIVNQDLPRFASKIADMTAEITKLRGLMDAIKASIDAEVEKHPLTRHLARSLTFPGMGTLEPRIVCTDEGTLAVVDFDVLDPAKRIPGIPSGKPERPADAPAAPTAPKGEKKVSAAELKARAEACGADISAFDARSKDGRAQIMAAIEAAEASAAQIDADAASLFTAPDPALAVAPDPACTGPDGHCVNGPDCPVCENDDGSGPPALAVTDDDEEEDLTGIL